MLLIHSLSLQNQNNFQIQDFNMDLTDDSAPQAINQVYKIWKKNVPFLYNILQGYELPSCSQTVQWLPDKYIFDSWEINHLVIGSNSITKNNVSVIQVRLPTDQSLVDHSTYKQIVNISDHKNDSANNVGTLGQQLLNVTKNFPQVGQIMKVRAFKGAYRKNQLLAVSVGGHTPMYFVYDLAQDQDVVDQNKVILDEHELEGFSIDWHPQNQCSLITGAFDHKLCLWDLTQSKSIAKPKSIMWHNSPLQDAKWCKKDTNLLGTACQDSTINLWDQRQHTEKPAMSRKAHKKQAYTLDFNNFSQHLLLSGGDSEIIMWDTRNLNKSLHQFIGHNDLISNVKWSTVNPYTFTSSSFDRRVVVWDMRCEQNSTQMLDEQDSKDIVFIHGGHRSKVTDFTWNEEGGVCASVQENNMLHVWQMNEKLQNQ